MEKKKFNPINFLYNKENKSYDDFIKEQVVINNVYHVINGTVKKI